MPDEVTVDSLGARLQQYLRDSDLPMPIKRYLGIKGLQGSMLGAVLGGGGDPQAEAESVFMGGTTIRRPRCCPRSAWWVLPRSGRPASARSARACFAR